MANLTPIPPIPGVSDLQGYIDFIGDDSKYSKRIKEMERVRKEINSLIELTAKAKEINALLGRARADRELAERELAQAKVKAGAVLSKADREAIAIERETKERRDRLEADEAKAKRELAEARRALTIREKTISEVEAEAKVLLAKSEQLKSEADAVRTRFAERLTILKDAVQRAMR
jgi:hypothetical protein